MKKYKIYDQFLLKLRDIKLKFNECGHNKQREKEKITKINAAH